MFLLWECRNTLLSLPSCSRNVNFLRVFSVLVAKDVINKYRHPWQLQHTSPIKVHNVHLYWTSVLVCSICAMHIARDPWSCARLHSFPGNQQCGIHVYTVLFHHIVIVSDKNYHNMVKKFCMHMYTILLVTWETVKHCVRSRISCMRCSVCVHLYASYFFSWYIYMGLWGKKPIHYTGL